MDGKGVDDEYAPLMLRRHENRVVGRAGPVGHPSTRAHFAAPAWTPVAATRAKTQKSGRLLTRSLKLEEWQWVTNPLPGTSEDHPPLGGKPSEVEVGEESTAIPR